MSKQDFTETEEERIIEIYKGQDNNGLEETLKSTAIKASDELQKEITLACVSWLLKRKGIPRKKRGRPGISHEGHFHGNGNSNQIRYSSLTEDMMDDVIYWFNEFGSNILAYKKVSNTFKEKYGKGLRYPVFEEILTSRGVDVRLEAYMKG